MLWLHVFDESEMVSSVGEFTSLEWYHCTQTSRLRPPTRDDEDKTLADNPHSKLPRHTNGIFALGPHTRRIFDQEIESRTRDPPVKKPRPYQPHTRRIYDQEIESRTRDPPVKKPRPYQQITTA
ncbi:hypothetical protein AVEN_195926-1 [Araneus ventricosus]|uniref:Uncharacterized protein n=1 Tax=Araneus ventricosus TaxID=182803 RepID=A0A4Y2HZG5_ARAVE|nr:hypothetical protein AVEN_195926-1 [Araneus ventricosus]